MALSQKHSGKIFVPWFNSYEWKYVYKLIYDEDSTDTDKNEALSILKLWKVRTPLLSSGIEGTMEILSAILHTNNLEETQLYNLWAFAIMRFLNICPANNKKQGTFYETAKRNNIPDWLISIRHDVSHGHRLPHVSDLKSGIDYCFNWLKREYWEVQDKLITDFNVSTAEEESGEDFLGLYKDIVEEMSLSNKLSVETTKRVMFLLKSERVSVDSNAIEILSELSRDIVENVRENDGQTLANYIIDVIKARETEDMDVILDLALKLWGPLIVYLSSKDSLHILLDALHDISMQDDVDNINVKCASFWLNAIFRGLHNSKCLNENSGSNGESSNQDCNINFDSITDVTVKMLKRFQDKVLENPNLLTLNYLRSLLLLNDNKAEFIESVESLVMNYVKVIDENMDISDHNLADVEIALGNLNSKPEEFDFIDENSDKPEEFNSPNITHISTEDIRKKKKRWTVVEDTSIFKGCPLGVLPGQDRTRNPLLTFRF